MQTIASRLLLSIGAVATVLFIAAFIVVDLVKQNLAEDAIKAAVDDYRKKQAH